MVRPRRYQDLERSALWLAVGLHHEAIKLLRLRIMIWVVDRWLPTGPRSKSG
jgi:hypothetical protein